MKNRKNDGVIIDSSKRQKVVINMQNIREMSKTNYIGRIIFVILVPVVIMLSHSLACRAASYNMTVGSSKTIYLNASQTGVMNAIWTSSDPWNVQIQSSSSL